MGSVWLLQLHLARTNNDRDSQLREHLNSGSRGRNLQTTWDKGPAGQLQPVPAEPLTETKIKALFAVRGFSVKPNKPELTGPSAATASDKTGSPPAPPGNISSYWQLLRLQDIDSCQSNSSQATLQNHQTLNYIDKQDGMQITNSTSNEQFILLNLCNCFKV